MKKWRFVSNQNSTIVGINDAGIETFTSNMSRLLVREIIQNSLDAQIEDSNNPVLVEFVNFQMPINDIPDVDRLREAMVKCKESNLDEADAFKFFVNAENLLGKETIDVLRISDHNTIGLEGSDTCSKGTVWSRLVKESGSSNKGKNSGGSFGIGKSAAFACSDLRTVFYSSMDSFGLKSNFGVAKLVSFKEDSLGGWTTGVGYYSDDDTFIAIPELAEYDKDYQRNDSGTDIYILGMHHSEEWQRTFINAVLVNFLVSLVKEKLVVNIQGKIIEKNSLSRYMAELNRYENDEIRDLLGYYDVLTSADPRIKKIPLSSKVYGDKYGFKDGDCVLYLKDGEGLNRKIMINRKAGMKIFEQNRISGSIEFTGVLVMEGDKMNETFKKMEVPSHDAWEPGRCRGEEKFYKNILTEFRRYLRNQVKECYGKVTTTTMDAFGASDFLPDKIEKIEEKKNSKNGINTMVKKLFGKSIEPKRKKTKPVDISEGELKNADNADTEGEGGSGPGSGKKHKKGKGPRPGSGDGPEKGNNSGNNSDLKKDKAYKEIPIKKRLICSNAGLGIYHLIFILPSTVREGKLEFILSGEQSDFKLSVKSAKITNSNTKLKIALIEDNCIFLENLKKGEKINMEVQVDFSGYCMMEVGYYAHKK